jgi:hypothetical protein
MKTHTRTRWWPYAAGLLLVCLANQPVVGQDSADAPLPRLLDLGRWATADGDRPCTLRNRCLHFFLMPTGVASDPLGADLDSDLAAVDGAGSPPPGAGPENPDSPFQAALFADNPYFDFRRPGDVGGPGFYRIHTQVQLLETETTGCTLGLQAVTPAGLENDGLAGGPTAFYPNLAVFHELFDGLAFQGFVGKNLRARPGWDDQLGRSLQYGVALAHPVPFFDSPALPQVHFFLEALGRYRVDGEASPGGAAGVWELLPGMHWRMGDNCWLSGGVLMPLNSSRRDAGLWQLTCSWQF